MRKIDLVFRTVGERTSEIALNLAIKHIAPDRVHLIDNVTPFSRAVQRMLEISYHADFVVFVDADCLIMEDMREFLDTNTQPYVDCYVLDRFRGRIHAGVHITRLDVLQAMQQVRVAKNDIKYILRPESYIRHLAMEQLDYSKAAAPFKIYHDFCQYYQDVFAKYALRELRSRTPEHGARLNRVMHSWPKEELDFVVARHAVQYTRDAVSPYRSEREVDEFIASLPQIAQREIATMALPEKPPLSIEEVEMLEPQFGHLMRGRNEKIFGIGLSRTGTKSLTNALDILGLTVAHNPVDEITFIELASGRYNLSVLNNTAGFDGITDIAAAAFYPQLDSSYPNSKFILTLREKEAWLNAMEHHWNNKPIFEDVPGQESKLKMRRFLRASIYGLYTFNRERLAYAYDRHHEGVFNHFKHRPDDLLVLNICEGEGWEKLCPFLEVPLLPGPFPHVRRKNLISGITGSVRV
ncbi:MAG: hypothetical protein H0T73_23210 [Ardenticatenales bacterium]|nr:hypothetical protein [Ardenticatenales bacterium]